MLEMQGIAHHLLDQHALPTGQVDDDSILLLSVDGPQGGHCRQRKQQHEAQKEQPKLRL
jgi:hypothetical protein